jgi:hypothetical protein
VFVCVCVWVGRMDDAKLTTVQGLMNSKGVTKFLLGVLTEIEDGALFLEDTTGECCEPERHFRRLFTPPPPVSPRTCLRGRTPLRGLAHRERRLALTTQLAPRAGSVRCDMSNSIPTVGLFTENCIIIAEGVLRADRVFEVVCLGFPHLESRIDFQ